MLWQWFESSCLFLHVHSIRWCWWWHKPGSLSDHLRPTQAQTFKSKDEENSQWPQPLQIAWISTTSKSYFWFQSGVVYLCVGSSNGGCIILKPIFIFSYNQNLEIKEREKQQRDFLKKNLVLKRVCATLRIIYCWKHSHSTKYWCQMLSGGD